MYSTTLGNAAASTARRTSKSLLQQQLRSVLPLAFGAADQRRASISSSSSSSSSHLSPLLLSPATTAATTTTTRRRTLPSLSTHTETHTRTPTSSLSRRYRLLSMQPSSSCSSSSASASDSPFPTATTTTTVPNPDDDDHDNEDTHTHPPPKTQPAEESHGIYPGENNVLPYTSLLQVVTPEQHPKWPVYRVLDTDGHVREGALEPQLAPETIIKLYTTMVRLQAMDTIFYNAQRQGRISFYMTATGEEAIHVGSAAALLPTDPVLAQYREAGVLMWRGFSLDQFADQCFSNQDDLGKGRQMPIHYGTAALHFQTISSPLATQIPQAVGAAYGVKLEDKDKPPQEKRCVICYFGEGAASEGDFHAALNFAATLNAPVLFFCRNNGYAISTSVKDQFKGDGIVSRAAGYGMHAIRVDGNDVFAVYNATKAAREICVNENKPVLIEAMTYRIGHHSTSDDSTRYRSLVEIKQWQEGDDPLKRFRSYMESKKTWSPTEETQLRDSERMSVLRALERAEVKPKPGVCELFTDVYHEKPRHLKEQEEEMRKHVEKYPEVYKDGGGGGH